MIKYFELFDDVYIPGRWHLGEVVDTSTNLPLELQDGIPANATVMQRVEVDRHGIALEFCLTSFAVPVAARRLADAIASIAAGDLQRLQVDIQGQKDFEILNSVRVIKCLDERRSEFTKWTEKDHRADLAGQYRMVTKLRVDPDRIPSDANFFRIEGWRIALIVSEKIKLAIQTHGGLGAKYAEVT